MRRRASWRGWVASLGLLVLVEARADDSKVMDGGQFRSEVHTVAGRIFSFSFADRALAIDTPDGPLRLTVDRNTAIYREDRSGSPRDLEPGASVKAAYGESGLAYWVEVRRETSAPGRGSLDGGLGSSGAGGPDGGSEGHKTTLPASGDEATPRDGG
jgi:hypothetical protein